MHSGTSRPATRSPHATRDDGRDPGSGGPVLGLLFTALALAILLMA